MKKIAFIVNPIAGGKASKKKLLILEKFAAEKDFEIFRTERAGHARKLATGLKDTYQCLAVFGGDGTINEVASELIDHPTSLAIIPAGSGNGLAYHLEIPIETEDALEYLQRPAKAIDTIQINNQYIINVGGLGFDGHVAKLFNESKSRGLFTYARLIISQLISFKEQDFKLTLDGNESSGKAFMLAFANGSEFGNRFIIDPQGDATDGKFSLVVVRKPPYHKLIPLLIDGFKGNLKESEFYKRYPVEEFFLSSLGSTLHRDGEVNSEESTGEYRLKLKPASLKIIY